MFSEKYKKNVGFTLEFADEWKTKVRVYLIVEYEDRETGFKFVDVEGKPLGVLELEKCTEKRIENFFRGYRIENAVEIIEAHYKMHANYVKECEEVIKEKEEEIAFWRNICKVTSDAERFVDRLNQVVQERTEEPYELAMFLEDKIALTAPKDYFYDMPVLMDYERVYNLYQEEGIEAAADYVIETGLGFRM